MKPVWTVEYYPLDQYGFRWTRKTRTAHIRARTRERAAKKAKETLYAEVVSVN